MLVQGAAGGIGTAAIQVAKAFGADRVIAVTSTPEKGAVALEAGADEFVLADGFKDAVTAQGGVDIVVDPVGGDRFTDSLRCLKDDGRLLVIGFTAGEIPTVKVNRLLLNNVSVVGVGWGAYVLQRVPATSPRSGPRSSRTSRAARCSPSSARRSRSRRRRRRCSPSTSAEPPARCSSFRSVSAQRGAVTRGRGRASPSS